MSFSRFFAAEAQEADDGGADGHREAEVINSCIEGTGIFFHDTQNGRSHEPAEVSNGVDERNAAGSSGMGQEKAWQGPERGLVGFDAGEGDGETGDTDGEVPFGERGEGECGQADHHGQDRMEPSLSRAISVPANKQLSSQGEGGREDHESGDAVDTEGVPLFENAGQKELNAIIGAGAEEVRHRQKQHLRMLECLQQTHPLANGISSSLDLLLEGIALLGSEPAGIARPIRQDEQDDDSKDDSRQSPENVNPLPSLKAEQCRMMNDFSIDDFVRADFKEGVGDFRAGDLRDTSSHRSSVRPDSCGDEDRRRHLAWLLDEIRGNVGREHARGYV